MYPRPYPIPKAKMTKIRKIKNVFTLCTLFLLLFSLVWPPSNRYPHSSAPPPWSTSLSLPQRPSLISQILKWNKLPEHRI
jgi:hypothetical protein